MAIYSDIGGDKHVLVRNNFKFKLWSLDPKRVPEFHRKHDMPDEIASEYIWVPVVEFIDHKKLNQWAFNELDKR